MRIRATIVLGMTLALAAASAGGAASAVAFAAPAAAPVAAAAVTASEETSPSVETSLTLLAVGDLMVHSGQLTAARGRGGYSFTASFAPVRGTIEAADLALGNLETTLRSRGFSGYPAFRSPASYASGLKAAGFDVLSTANNHSLDGGATGVRYTTSYLDRIGLRHFGTNDVKPIVVERNGIRIAFASYTYATNGIRSPFSGAVNRIGLARMRSDIAAVRPDVDLVVVFVHWGSEYSTRVEGSTRSTGRALIDAGADLVLGSHPHVVRPIERYDGHYIVYSMGNFLSGQSKYLTDLGIMVTAKVSKDASGTTVSGLRVLPTFRDRSGGRGRSTYRTVLIDRALAAPDRLISAADRSRMRSYRAFARRMFAAYY